MSQATKIEPLGLYRASSIGDLAAPQVIIEIRQEIDVCKDVDEIERFRQIYARDANALAEALFLSLPGGTIDALLVAMLQQKASILRVPYETRI